MNKLKWLTDDERSYLEEFLRARLETEGRDPLMILVALHSGARASELLAITWNDLNVKTGELYIKTLKKGRPRIVVLPKFLLGPLKRLKLASHEKPFPIKYNRLGEIWRVYRPATKPFHSLRHSFAQRVYAKTKDIRFVQKCLGHADIRNTMVYADYDYSAAEFKKIMKMR